MPATENHTIADADADADAADAELSFSVPAGELLGFGLSLAQAMAAMLFAADPRNWPAFERWTAVQIEQVAVEGLTQAEIRDLVSDRVTPESMALALVIVDSILDRIDGRLGYPAEDELKEKI